MPFQKKTYSLRSNLPEKEIQEIEHCNQITAISEGTTVKIETAAPKRQRNALLGFFYMIVCVATYAIYTVIVKKLSYISPGQFSVARNAGIFAGCLPIAVVRQENILGKKEDRLILITRGFLGATALYLNILAYAFLPLADAAVILSMVPTATILIARLYLRERCGLIQSASLVITLCGVLLSIRLPKLLQERTEYQFDHNYILGVVSAFACVLTLSTTYVILRKMKNLHFTILTFYLGFLGMIENIIINGIMMDYSPIHCGWDQFWYIAVGILGFAGNSSLSLALQVEEAGIVSIERSCLEILIAIIFQIIFFREHPDLYSVGGGILVISALSILGTRNWLLNLPENSKLRRKLKYLLI